MPIVSEGCTGTACVAKIPCHFSLETTSIFLKTTTKTTTDIRNLLITSKSLDPDRLNHHFPIDTLEGDLAVILHPGKDTGGVALPGEPLVIDRDDAILLFETVTHGGAIGRAGEQLVGVSEVRGLGLFRSRRGKTAKLFTATGRHAARHQYCDRQLVNQPPRQSQRQAERSIDDGRGEHMGNESIKVSEDQSEGARPPTNR